MKRNFPLKEQLAAALRDMMVMNQDGDWERAIPWEHARNMTAEQVLSLFQRDHYPIRHEMGGPNVHWNCQWLFKGRHRDKTAKKDQPEIAKSKRIREAEQTRKKISAAAALLRRDGTPVALKQKPKAKIKSRGFSKVQRKMQGKSSWPKSK